jgi:hypothetical protein
MIIKFVVILSGVVPIVTHPPKPPILYCIVYDALGIGDEAFQESATVPPSIA